MTTGDIIALSRKIHGIYGERFPILTPDMAHIWLEALGDVDEEVLDTSLLRWARQHQTTYAPTLQNLLDTIDLVEDDARRLHGASRDVSRTTEVILADAAREAPEALRSWAHCHVEMFLDGLCKPERTAEAAARCREYAAQYPADRQDWQAVAVWYDLGAPRHLGPLGQRKSPRVGAYVDRD